MRIALAQINPTVGDIDGNTRRIIEQIHAAESAGADLVVLPELAIFGYPPADLLLRDDLVRKNTEALEHIATQCVATTAVVGYVRPEPAGTGKGLSNSAAVCRGGAVIATFAKMLLPTYDVFEEQRYFDAGSTVQTFDLPTADGSICAGLTICEDLWNDRQFQGRRVYGIDPVAATVAAGASLLINISASPYRVGSEPFREELFAEQIREHGVPLVCTNQVGGNDELIFDGASLALDGSGRVVARAKAFEEDLLLVDLGDGRGNRIEPYPSDLESTRRALILGLRDYTLKCGFQKVLLGLSGGIDSALTAVLAVEALGKDCVCGVSMPSRFSSSHSLEDARQLAANLGINFTVIPIEGVHRAMEEALVPQFHNLSPGVAEENVQARIRGNILMALSNKFGWLLLATGNKSELAVGYCTLYGDMCGGVAVLSDVPKTGVYELARHVNDSADHPLIPTRTLDKPPSAELRKNQCDQDSLPPYDILDAVLAQYVENRRSPDDIVAAGFDRATVEQVVAMVNRNEYKRRQIPVGLKVTSLAFGKGRRMPIAARYR